MDLGVWRGISEVPLGPQETVYKWTKYVFHTEHNQDCKCKNCSNHQDGGQIIHINSGLSTKKLLIFCCRSTEARQEVLASSPWCGPNRTGCKFEQGCLVFTEKAGGGGAERVTPSLSVSTADQTMIPSGPQPSGQERDVAG